MYNNPQNIIDLRKGVSSLLHSHHIRIMGKLVKLENRLL